MIKIFVNNKVVLIPKNTSVLEACESVGVSVPRFCYHERLNVAGNCRMCLVEIEKAPKPIASCAFPVAPNMKIYTDTPLVQKARENVLEFLLINHPLDCPICDQGGECDLQEQTMVFGTDRSRFFYAKRSVQDKNCGPLIKTIMTRCIHCTRCVRFLQNVAGQEDLGTTLRGQETEIGTYIGKNLNSELSGNIIDLCPVGALTSKPYAFTARPWEIKSVETIDVHDSVGSNIRINFKETEIFRILPALNDSLNEEWISDKTRFSFDGLKRQRIGTPFLKKGSVQALESYDPFPCLTHQLSIEAIEGYHPFFGFTNRFSSSSTSPSFLTAIFPNRITLQRGHNKTCLKFLMYALSIRQDLFKSSWSKTLIIFSKMFSKQNLDQILFICGNMVDLETINIFKKTAQCLNVLLISETFLNINSNLMTSVKINTTFREILESDLCLTIGTNVRFEASLLNVRLKKRARKGVFIKASIGLNENLTYENHSIGNSLKTLIDIAEGRHPFCQKLVKAKTPFIILGSSIKKRIDSKAMTSLFNKLAKYTKLMSENWLGINFLPTTVNLINKTLAGIDLHNKLDLSKKKFIYCVGLDSDEVLNLKGISLNAFIVAQTPYSNSFLKTTNLIFPSTAFTEKEGTFLNLEGRIQKTTTALLGPNSARNDSKIIEILFPNSVKKNDLPSVVSLNQYFFATILDFTKNKETFTRALVVKKKKGPSKIIKTPLKIVLSNFFASNAITNNSLIMGKCASTFKKNYVNFI